MSDQGRNDALKKLESAHATYISEARTVANQLWAQGAEFLTTDIIRENCPIPDDIDHRVMGVIFTRSEWETCGWDQARGHCNTRPIRRFRKRQKAA